MIQISLIYNGLVGSVWCYYIKMINTKKLIKCVGLLLGESECINIATKWLVSSCSKKKFLVS